MASIDVYTVGQNIDQYEVVAIMHTTPKSHLYKVQSKGVHKQQVLKLQAINTSSDAINRFHDQANLLLEFSSHASIVDVLHVGSIEDRPFMVMPYYAQTLSDLLAVHQQKLSFVTSLHIINQVLDALNSIHHLHIVHCDIKPQNIFLDEKNNALLADFDSALVLRASPFAGRFGQNSHFLTQSKTFTPGYASPEQYQLQLSSEQVDAKIDNKSDMYSLGMLWYRMLTGMVLKDGDTVNDALRDVAPAWAMSLIETLLSKDKTKRPDANQCKTHILTQTTKPEINHTIRVDALELSPQTELVCDEINKTMFSPFTIKRYLLPLLVIVSVFVYWMFASQGEAQFAQHNQVKAKAMQSSTTIDSEFANTQHNYQTKDSTNMPSTEEAKLNLPEQTSPSAFETDIIRSQFTQQSVNINWVRLDSLPNIKIMSTEVTNDLFDMCALEGACKKRQRFTTANTNSVNPFGKGDYPKVNIDWYEVTQQFIPWLNRKTQRRFLLPSLKQWQAIYSSNLATTGTAMGIHCKNCKHKLATQYVNGTMPVTAINPSRVGMYHVIGNAQEWLSECWQQTSADNILIQRCDQAMVAGGSWLSKYSDIIEQPVSQLLKSAVSPTTGFRLVEVVNE